eukprot:TRINITY_DN57384_c0_g1_i1.p1 TRINITY_DN57384_c0_g1~~TRINITY_DN57384_c0_g1_i1.p1  ORF type:complete len:260 (-),score=21.12 TRINITY_DN57384_c0_g1_i1:307-1086(-)
MLTRTYSPDKTKSPGWVAPHEWDLRVQELKARVISIEEAEGELINDFTERERQFIEDVEKLEDMYTKEMENIRETDLRTKDDVRRKAARKRRKARDQTKLVQADRLQQQQELLQQREINLERELQKREDMLQESFREQEAQLKEKIRQARATATGYTPDNDFGRQNSLAIDVVNAASRGTGGRVLQVGEFASSCGIAQGDIITNVTTALDIRSRNDIKHLMAGTAPSEQMMLTILREHQREPVQVVLTVARNPHSRPAY